MIIDRKFYADEAEKFGEICNAIYPKLFPYDSTRREVVVVGGNVTIDSVIDGHKQFVFAPMSSMSFRKLSEHGYSGCGCDVKNGVRGQDDGYFLSLFLADASGRFHMKYGIKLGYFHAFVNYENLSVIVFSAKCEESITEPAMAFMACVTAYVVSPKDEEVKHITRSVLDGCGQKYRAAGDGEQG